VVHSQDRKIHVSSLISRARVICSSIYYFQYRNDACIKNKNNFNEVKNTGIYLFLEFVYKWTEWIYLPLDVTQLHS
jgi:hypothetical protein